MKISNFDRGMSRLGYVLTGLITIFIIWTYVKDDDFRGLGEGLVYWLVTIVCFRLVYYAFRWAIKGFFSETK